LSDLWRARRITLYILLETIPSFLLCILVFSLIPLIPESLRLTELLLTHEAKVQDLLQLIIYSSTNTLPLILPMSLLLTTLLTYGRLGGDSEIVAMKSLGFNLKHLSLPAIILGVVTALLSAHVAFYLAPRKHQKFEMMLHEIKKVQAKATIREGVFSEGLFNIVLYTNDIDSEKRRLRQVFIFDERDSQSPLTIIAQRGELIQFQNKQGSSTLLHLKEGSIHQADGIAYTKVDFQSYNINLFHPVSTKKAYKPILSHTLDDIKTSLKDPHTGPNKKHKLKIEYHRRLAFSIACLIFALLAVSFGVSTNHRSTRKDHFTICIGVIFSYWLLYVISKRLAHSGIVPAAPTVWLTNSLFIIITAWRLKRIARV